MYNRFQSPIFVFIDITKYIIKCKLSLDVKNIKLSEILSYLYCISP